MSTKKTGWETALAAKKSGKVKICIHPPLTEKRMRSEIRTEAGIEQKVIHEAAKRWGVQSTKMGTAFSTGWPDRLFFIPGGVPLMIEFKRPGGRLSTKQEFIHMHLRAAGYKVSVHDNVDEALNDIYNALPTTL